MLTESVLKLCIFRDKKGDTQVRIYKHSKRGKYTNTGLKHTSLGLYFETKKEDSASFSKWQ